MTCLPIHEGAPWLPWISISAFRENSSDRSVCSSRERAAAIFCPRDTNATDRSAIFVQKLPFRTKIHGNHAFRERSIMFRLAKREGSHFARRNRPPPVWERPVEAMENALEGRFSLLGTTLA